MMLKRTKKEEEEKRGNQEKRFNLFRSSQKNKERNERRTR